MVREITTDLANRYILQRQDEGAANATINRALAIIKRSLHLGEQRTPKKVRDVPYIPMITENKARSGFFESAEFEVLEKQLPKYLKNFARFGYLFGWRKGEIQGLTWANVDWERECVRLNPGDTKNNEGRTVYFNATLRRILEEQREERKLAGGKVPYVFMNRKRTGPVGDIRVAWNGACRKAGLEGRLFHDLRRTAVRDLLDAGNSENEVRAITGHKTRCTFDRYNIVSDKNLRRLAERTEEYHQRPKGERKVEPITVKQRKRNVK